MSGSKIVEYARRGAAGLTLAAAFGIGAAAFAKAANDAAADAAPAYAQVESFTMLQRPHSWQALDADSVIVWATPWDPYLVELAFPSHDLRFARVLGLTSFGSRVYAKFDAVNVGGFRYPIASIFKMTREEARSLARQS